MAFKRLDPNGVRRRPKFTVCYLCGKDLPKPKERSADHVPPKDFFGRLVLEALKADLWTVPTHTECNNSYKNDEEYLIATLRYHVQNTWAGKALTIDFLGTVTEHEGTQRLFGKVYREMEWQHTRTTSSYTITPVAMNHEDHRIDRVCWKVVRGLYFLERGVVLPERTPLIFGVLNHISQMTDGVIAWWQTASGSFPYPRVFDYRFKLSNAGEEQWMLYLWEGLTWMASFQVPNVAQQSDARESAEP